MLKWFVHQCGCFFTEVLNSALILNFTRVFIAASDKDRLLSVHRLHMRSRLNYNIGIH